VTGDVAIMGVDFAEQLKSLAGKVEEYKALLQTEQAVKNSLIEPFFRILGYDFANPKEVLPEFDCSFGSKKDLRVDYAITQESKPIILIEAKHFSENLEKNRGQLAEYFAASSAKFGILTNGIEYMFYTDLDDKNKLDGKPFFVVNLLGIREPEIAELKKFHKSNFSIDAVFSTAEELKYNSLIKKLFEAQMETPDDEFVKYVAREVYDRSKIMQSVVEKLRPIVKKASDQFIEDIVYKRLKDALKTTEKSTGPTNTTIVTGSGTDDTPKIETTESEIGAFHVIRNLLKHSIDAEKITYKDTTNYLAVVLDGKPLKWICRLYLSQKNPYIEIPADGDRSVEGRKKLEALPIKDIYEIEQYKDKLVASLQSLLEPKNKEQ
jgi:hypothetical protein